MKNILLLNFFLISYLFSFDLDLFDKTLKNLIFDSIGQDHLERIWVRNSQNGEIKFLIDLNNVQEFKSISGYNFLFDIDFDWGEIFAEIGSTNFYLLKKGSLIGKFDLERIIMGLCWLDRDNLAFAVLKENNEVIITKYNLNDKSQKELFIFNEKYNEYFPSIYLKLNKEFYLIAFDYYNYTIAIYDIKKFKVIARRAEVRQKDIKNSLYIVKKERIGENGSISSQKYLILKNKFGLDKEGNFFVLKDCNSNVFLERLIFSKGFWDLEGLSLKECPDFVFYHNGYFIFYSQKNKKVSNLEYFNDKFINQKK